MTSEKKVEIAMIGQVNVGKSSIIKYLTEDSSIHIYPIPGETVKVTNYTCEEYDLVDTPGLNDTRIENVKKTTQVLKCITYIVFVLNAAGTVLSKNELKTFKKLRKNKKHILIAINKSDKADSIEAIERFVRKETEASSPIVIISTKSGEGMNELKEELVKLLKM